MDGLEELENRTARRRRAAGGSRNPRPGGSGGEDAVPPPSAAEAAAQARRRREEEEAQRRTEEEAQRRAEEEARRAAQEAQGQAPEAAQPEPSKKRSRPKATPVYLDPDIENWLWEIREVAARLQVDVPVSAVARRAFRQLMATSTPAQIVANVQRAAEPPSNESRRPGRPRR